jgi:rhodanese-related sulfurtransferase
MLAFTATVAIAQQAGAGSAVNGTPAPTQERKFKSPLLNRAQVDALLAKPEELLIIDVRRPDELANKGGFPVYLSIPAKELEKSLAYIPRDRTIVTVSNHAGRAGPAADLLTAKGFKVAGAIGADGYAEEGGTLVKIAPPPPRQPAAGQDAAATR